MPQMAPLWWTTLYILFLGSLMMTAMIIYFNINYKMMQMKSMSNPPKMMNWKW